MPSRVPSEHLTLTSVPGIRVGHAQDIGGATGCTVVICPPETVAAVEVWGGAPATRETDLLRPGRLVEHVDAVLLAGGSAFGLAAADGVVRFLEAGDRGFRTPRGRVPIVPGAMLYDLDVGSADARPDADMGHAACAAARSTPVPRGSIGAGTGSSVGKLRGITRATKSGLGSAGLRLPGDVIVAALFAVNALGDVVDERGDILAGLRKAPQSGEFVETTAAILEAPRKENGFFQNTVIGVVATNARLGRDPLAMVTRMAHAGIARSVRPSHTPFDGDTVFALSTGALDGEPLAVGVAAAEVTASAIRDAVREAVSLGGVPARRDL